MRILVVNGSPKGAHSVTLKTAEYIAAQYPEHDFDYFHAAAGIHALEKDFSPAAEKLQNADLIIFAYPVYTFLAPSQLHRFFELAKENGISLEGRQGSQITTSKHFYDTTAHSFVEDNMLDIGLTVYPGLSADMEDLLTEAGRKQASDYFKRLTFQIERDMGRKPVKETGHPCAPYTSSSIQPAVKKSGYRVALVYIAGEQDTNLRAMIEDFDAALPYELIRCDVGSFPFRGGCLGCLSCAQDGTCVYQDGFDTFLRDRIQGCDAVVYAFPVRNHFTDSRMKMFDDRQFCNGHRTVTEGSPVGYLISGRYNDETNLKTVLEARASVGGNYWCGVATDEDDPRKAITDLAATITMALEENLSAPRNFLGVGGGKIFRDLVYGMQGFMRADHRFFKKNGMYDFPQKDKRTLWGMRMVGSLMRIPSVKKEVQPKLSGYMLRPYEEIVNKSLKSEPVEACPPQDVSVKHGGE